MFKNLYNTSLRRSVGEVLCLNRNIYSYSRKKNLLRPKSIECFAKRTKKFDKRDASHLFVPLQIKNHFNGDNVGVELGGKLNKQDLIRTLSKFYQRPEVRLLAAENGLDDNLMHQAFISFRKHCIDNDLPPDIHLIISDVIQGAGHVDDLFPYFLRHARQVFPHLDCLDDLKKISDLRTPASWYPEARSLNRKVIFHAGPTNSGKTYQALQRYLSAKSGVYCGPLKLLASEIYHKANKKGTPCDLVTGEERRHASHCDVDKPEVIMECDAEPSPHVACTVEMTSLTNQYEVAIIDEIQLIGDKGRGWAWTRAFLGLQAHEVHLCGEAGAIPLIEELCNSTGEELKIHHYKRLTRLDVEDRALCSLESVEPGDCIVCFSKHDIYTVSRAIEKSGREVAVIYGSLPPGTKLAQANKFNDPENPCKVMVATDAIGLGINLSIRRIIFYSLIKPMLNEKGEKEMDVISISQALQIAGRAGRYGSAWETGYVTTYKPEDLPTLKILLSQLPEKVEQAGLHPTAEQMELYAYHLPHASLSSLMDIFVHLCTVDDSLYFMCNTEAFKFLAEMIQHVPLPLRARYVFCCSPINQKVSFVCAMFLKMVRQYSKNEAISWNWLANAIEWPFSTPKTIMDLVHLEATFDVLDLYLWLSYRFEDLFPDAQTVRDMQKQLDYIIQQGIFQITKLLRNSEVAMGQLPTDDAEFERIDSPVKNKYIKRFPKSIKHNYQEENYEEYVDSENLKNKRIHGFDRNMSVGGKRLSDRLLAQGLLTPKMLKQLQDELSLPDKNKTNKKDTSSSSSRRKYRK